MLWCGLAITLAVQKYEPPFRSRYIRPIIGRPPKCVLPAAGEELVDGEGLGDGPLDGLAEAEGVLDGVGLVVGAGGGLLGPVPFVGLSVGTGDDEGRSIVLKSCAASRIRPTAAAGFGTPFAPGFLAWATGFFASSGSGIGLASAIRAAVQNCLASLAVQRRDSGSAGGASSGIACADMDWSSVNWAVIAEALGHRKAPATTAAPAAAPIIPRRFARCARRLARRGKSVRTLVDPPRGTGHVGVTLRDLFDSRCTSTTDGRLRLAAVGGAAVRSRRMVQVELSA
ncbi:hypothetical protein GCM10009753_18270 [Streptantibioticus ferralitis]